MNDLTRLKWHCRRGTLELDTLLQHYLETAYPVADAKEQALFKSLLHYEDDMLVAFLVWDKQPESENLLSLVNNIRNAAGTSNTSF